MDKENHNRTAGIIYDLKQKLAACQKNLAAERALNKTLQSKQASAPKEAGPLSRSSLEAYSGIAIGIVLAVSPMTYWLRACLFLVLGFLCVDFAWKLSLTYRWKRYAKVPLAAAVGLLVIWIGWGNVSRAYEEQKAPPPDQYIISFGGLDPNIHVSGGDGIATQITGTPGCHILVEGDKLTRYATDFDLVGVCFHWDGMEDFKDVTNICKSDLFDIHRGRIQILIRANEEYISELKKGNFEVSYFLLLVPKHVSPESFTSLRGAISKGAMIVDQGSQQGGA